MERPARSGRRQFVRRIGAVAGLGLLAGCAEAPAGEAARNPTTTSATGEDPVRIGVSLPYSGFMAEEGPELTLGMEFWRREVNAAGGLLDRPVEFVVYDDGSTEDGAAAAYERLVDEDDVDLVLGSSGTLASAGGIRVLEERGMPCVFPHSWGPYAWDEDREWCVPFLPIARDAPRGLAEVLTGLGVETFASIRSSSGYARDGTDGLHHHFEEEGVEVVDEVVYPRYDGEERRAALQRVVDADADAVGPGGSVAEVKPLIEELEGMDTDDPAFAWFDFDDTRLFSLADAAEGMLGLAIWTARADFPENDRFVEEFLDWAAPRRPDWSNARLLQHHGIAAYAGALVLQRAVEAAGNFDPAAVRDALWALDTETPYGRFAVDEDGYQVGKEMLVLQFQRRLREVVWPPEMRTAEPRLPTVEHPG